MLIVQWTTPLYIISSSRNTNLDACNDKTFGQNHMNGWSAEDMFKLNEQKFGIHSTYNIDNYTTPLNCNDEKKGSRYLKETLKSVNLKNGSSNAMNGLMSSHI
ncbi:mRNA-decapping enzyme 2,putative [Plasmodium gaboni]|uniref:mRNA-decapping enzyme 2,putative n=1 Tax=Plasmodium gaboni TaxID=647221 RepID=A0ABY0KVX2_9APIC|nr:mRNA-decapping enzyme 2,putative [Plasmodium gaboni]